MVGHLNTILGRGWGGGGEFERSNLQQWKYTNEKQAGKLPKKRTQAERKQKNFAKEDHLVHQKQDDVGKKISQNPSPFVFQFIYPELGLLQMDFLTFKSA